MIMSGLAMTVSWMSTHSFNRWAQAHSVTPSTVSVLRVPPQKKMPSKFGVNESFTFLNHPGYCWCSSCFWITTALLFPSHFSNHYSYCCVLGVSESHQLLLCFSRFWITPVTVVFFTLLNHHSYCCFSHCWITTVTVVFLTLPNHHSYCCVFNTSVHFWITTDTVVSFMLLNHHITAVFFTLLNHQSLLYFSHFWITSHCCFLHASASQSLLCFSHFWITTVSCFLHTSESPITVVLCMLLNHQSLLYSSHFWITPATVVFFMLLNHPSCCCGTWEECWCDAWLAGEGLSCCHPPPWELGCLRSKGHRHHPAQPERQSWKKKSQKDITHMNLTEECKRQWSLNTHLT